MTRIPHLYGATFALIFNNKSQILLQQRQNTWYYDGWWQLPSWHIDDGESATNSIQHECIEELWIIIQVNEKDVFHVIHRLNSDRQYIDIGFTITVREGEISNKEPDKCSTLERFDCNRLPKYTSPTTLRFIEAYQTKQTYSEILETL